MKFSFTSPAPNDTSGTTMESSSPPLGILYLSSFLKKAGIEVSALDQSAEKYSIKQVVDWIIKEDPEVLGISTLLSSSYTTMKIAKEVKSKNPNIVICLGNHHATFNAERILKKYPEIDVIVRGEGEHTCLEFANCVKENNCLKTVPGITFRHNHQIITNMARPLIEDIDTLPFPDRDLLQVDYHNTIIGINVAPKKFTTVLSSRGCSFKCRFCNCASIARNFWRKRSLNNIMEELHLLVSEGYEQIMFVDDNFTFNQKSVIKLCQRMRQERIDLEWICEGRVAQSSSNLFKAMVKAGCRIIYFGIESASRQILNYYNKGITPKQSEQAVIKAREAGVDVIVGSFIIGAPNESRNEIQQTLNFSHRLDLDIPQINVLEVFPGTPIWEELKNNRIFNEELYWETGVQNLSNICPESVSLNELRHMIDQYYQDLLKSPRYFIKQGLLTLNSKYRLNVLFKNMYRINDITYNLSSFQRYWK